MGFDSARAWKFKLHNYLEGYVLIMVMACPEEIIFAVEVWERIFMRLNTIASKPIRRPVLDVLLLGIY